MQINGNLRIRNVATVTSVVTESSWNNLSRNYYSNIEFTIEMTGSNTEFSRDLSENHTKKFDHKELRDPRLSYGENPESLSHLGLVRYQCEVET